MEESKTTKKPTRQDWFRLIAIIGAIIAELYGYKSFSAGIVVASVISFFVDQFHD